MSREVLFININNEFRAFVVFSCFLVQIQEDVQELYVFLVNKMMDSSLEYKKIDVGSPGLAKCTAVQNMFEGAVIAEVHVKLGTP